MLWVQLEVRIIRRRRRIYTFYKVIRRISSDLSSDLIECLRLAECVRMITSFCWLSRDRIPKGVVRLQNRFIGKRQRTRQQQFDLGLTFKLSNLKVSGQSFQPCKRWNVFKGVLWNSWQTTTLGYVSDKLHCPSFSLDCGASGPLIN